MLLKVAVVNFSNQSQRDTVFNAFDLVLPLSLGPDSMTHALSIALAHDQWAQADPVAYMRHVTRDPLPGSHPKDVLLSIGLHDQKSPNIFSDIAARDLRIPSLDGSFRSGLVGIPDVSGPLSSAYVAYWTALDVDDGSHAEFIPPLANRTAKVTSACDPHVLTWQTPAYLDQVGHFFQPGGRVVNFCTGLCDGLDPGELEWGNAERCDPTP